MTKPIKIISLFIFLLFFQNNFVFAASRSWTGGAADNIFNTPGNWTGAGALLTTDDLTMNISANKYITLNATVQINSLAVNVSGNGTNFELDALSYTLTISGTTTADNPSGNNSTYYAFEVSTGTIIYNGTTTFNTTVGYGYPCTTHTPSTTTGQFIFRGDATFNNQISSLTTYSPNKVIFDANGSQTITNNITNTGSYDLYLGTTSTEIGSSYNPTVTFAGTKANSFPLGDLNINGTSTLILPAGHTLNRKTSGGTINIAAGATMKLGDNTGGQGSSNFPSNFTTFSFNATSTVEYNSNNGVNQTIYSGSTYGNLTLTNGSGAGATTKTAGGNLTIAGNLLINSNATFAAGTSLTHNLAGDWTNNGSFSYTTADMVNFNGNNALQTISGSGATGFNNITVNKGADVTKVLEANGVGAISSNGTMTMTNGLFKMTTGTFSFVPAASPLNIPSSSGIWVNGATVNSGNTSYTNNGWIKITSGTAAFGTASGNELQTMNNGYFDMQGGTVNISGRFYNTASGAAPTGIPSTGISITAGTMNVCTVGNANATTADFHMSATSNMAISGGTIVIQTPNSNAVPFEDLDIIVGGTKTLTGGTFQIGNGSGSNFKISSALNLYNLTTNCVSAMIDINTNVNNTLTMTAGNVNLNTFTLTLGTAAASPGTLTYTAGFLYGTAGTFTRWFNTTSFAIANAAGHFPMGTSSGDYRPIWIAYSANLTTGGTVSVIHVPTYPSGTIAASHVDGSWAGGTTLQGVSNSYWTISTANSFTLNGSTGIIRYGGQGFGTYTLTDLDASLTAAVTGTYGASTNANTPLEVNRTGLATTDLVVANLWRIGTKNKTQSPLPVEFLSLTAQPEENSVKVNWSTATEFNSNYFIVQRSKDGIVFEDIEKISASDNSTTVKNYSAIDVEPYKGISYYRLKQVDFDGKFYLTDIVAVNFTSEEEISVYPNPSNGTFALMFDEFPVQIKIYNASGEIVFESTINNKQELIKLNSPSGIYFLTAASAEKVLEKKIIIR